MEPASSFVVLLSLSNLMGPSTSQRSILVQPPSQTDNFDVKSFCDMTHDFGRAYRHRAIELIKICQRFSASSEQSFRQYVALSRSLFLLCPSIPRSDPCLVSVLETCDMAVASAINSRKKKTQEADFYFDIAIRGLTEYDSQFHDR